MKQNMEQNKVHVGQIIVVMLQQEMFKRQKPSTSEKNDFCGNKFGDAYRM